MNSFSCSQCGVSLRKPAFTRTVSVRGTANGRTARVLHYCASCERAETAQRIAGARAAAAQTLREGGYSEAEIELLLTSC